jgi:hypothetical protein
LTAVLGEVRGGGSGQGRDLEADGAQRCFGGLAEAGFEALSEEAVEFEEGGGVGDVDEEDATVEGDEGGAVEEGLGDELGPECGELAELAVGFEVGLFDVVSEVGEGQVA